AGISSSFLNSIAGVMLQLAIKTTRNHGFEGNFKSLGANLQFKPCRPCCFSFSNVALPMWRNWQTR
ncbi:MAG TPA: hypothetical protein DCR17_12675, partial [Verrucomicrobiales bacterium]|nr:hypothetical protein [Verrucomicrobiales bacterium]